ncbi:hypothetical protein [Paenibacillus silvisoli]|uniref:hypothetical protein n=1 Tax=Paenibacillus silvisoli TaxID=3110539 RepID=UPI002804BA94|nr:hypothetical protein [Paenibacillus silvisoli]
MNGFDPIIALNVHVALLKALEKVKDHSESSKGVAQSLIKAVGRIIFEELEKSKRTMRENNMWVNESPVQERRYRYSHFGSSNEYVISNEELELHFGIVMRTLQHKIDKFKFLK